MAAEGTYEKPQEKWCWSMCLSCNRCDDKGKYDKCKSCSGRIDPDGHIDEHPDDFCDCKNGNLRWRTQQGRLVVVKFKSNPFAKQVKYEKQSEDERDWNGYVKDMREKMDRPNWNPISFY